MTEKSLDARARSRLRRGANDALVTQIIRRLDEQVAGMAEELLASGRVPKHGPEFRWLLEMAKTKGRRAPR